MKIQGPRSWLRGLFAALFALLLSGAEAPLPVPAPRAAVVASVVLKVSDRDQTANALVKKAENLRGYFASRSDEMVVLKVPVDRTAPFLKYAESLGLVVERTFETEDLGFALDQAQANLGSREEMMKRYREVLRSSSQNGILQVEQEITRLVGEIETLKGAIKLTQHRLGFATVTVSFVFRERRAPAKDGRSSFRWLNSVNMEDLVEDFR